MNWEDKTKMVQLHNADKKEEMYEHILAHVQEFDKQDWDMFATVVFINVEQMLLDNDFWKKVWQYLKDIDCNDFGMRTGMRIALIQTICEDELKLKNNTDDQFSKADNQKAS